MIKKFGIAAGVVLLAVIIAATGCPPQAEPAPADFYKGKTIDFVVAQSPGSAIDLISRVVASHLGSGTGASVIVANREGAGGLEGMNYVYKAGPDGLTMGTVASSKFVGNRVLNDPAAVYEIEKFSYIISIDRQSYYFFVSPEGPYQSVADLQAGKDLKLGGGSPSGSVCLGGLTVIKLLGLEAEVITGFGSESDRALAVERGEVIGYCLNMPNARASVEAGMVKPMFVLATERDPLTPDVPAITELVELDVEDLALARLWETALAGSTLCIASPGIAEDRLAFLRDIAEKLTQDEGFRAEINTVSGYEVQSYVTGEELAAAMLDTVANLDDFQAIFIELIEKYRA
jgi:tripartite-type tricarboxylate transporter receptor subunit TctC